MRVAELEVQRSDLSRLLELLEEDSDGAEPDPDQLARIELLRSRLNELKRLIAEQGSA